jgi:quercetin dioxygenase-like cupin family protein
VGRATVTVEPWSDEEPPTEAAIRRVLQDEGLSFYRWSNAPGDVYAAHTHAYHKVIYVVQGSITFGLPGENREVKLQVGDRLELPPEVAHNASVGSQGVACLEAHRR